MKSSYPKLTNIKSSPSLQETAFQAIKRAMIENEFKPGEVYSERIVAKILGFSKTPVHHALLDLASKGLITILPQKGFRVNILTPKDSEDLYKFRLALEKAVILEITPRLSQNDFGNLDHILKKMSETQESVAFQKHDRSFHMYLASQTDNAFVIEALDGVWDLSDWLGTIATSANKSVFKRIVKEHRAILEMLEKRNIDQSLDMLEKHIQEGIDRYLSSVYPIQKEIPK